MPNPDMPRQNSKSFDPDKGLPLIAERPIGFPKKGQGATVKACEDYQMYTDGKEVKLVVEPKLPTRKYTSKKGK